MAIAIGTGLMTMMRRLTPLIIWWRIAGYDFGNLSQSKSYRYRCDIHWYSTLVLTERGEATHEDPMTLTETSLVLLAILHE